MDFKYIYLLGVDFFNYGVKIGSYVSHFHQEEKTRLVSYGGKQVFLVYVVAKKYVDENYISLYNATREGKLEIFNRVDFDKLYC